MTAKERKQLSLHKAAHGRRRASAGGLELSFTAIAEDQPGPVWQAAFDAYWPAYRAWYLSEGLDARPTYLECRTAIRKHMPEMEKTWQTCTELAGGGDVAARFLSMYGPPAYVAGCSQAVWHGESPALVRNYDYYPKAFDALVMQTRWLGKRLTGMADGMMGVLDGMNEDGLAVSLTFGGRRTVGVGFGVPILLRYVLETCSTVGQATKALKRLPCHMAYNVTLLDKAGRWATVFLNPDREAVITKSPVATNHQHEVEWHQHARATASLERERLLRRKLSLHKSRCEDLVAAFLRPPLYSLAFARGYGTLYTTVYRPKEGCFDLRWPGQRWSFTVAEPRADNLTAHYEAEEPVSAAR